METGEGKTVVVLVSLLRDFNFWMLSASKLGLDLFTAGNRGNFVFVDGLDIFLPPSATAPSIPSPISPKGVASQEHRPWQHKLISSETFRGRAVRDASPLPQRPGDTKLEVQLEKLIKSISSDLGPRDSLVLVLDGLDFYLAATGRSSPEADHSSVLASIYTLRQLASTTIITSHADDPLIHPFNHSDGLESTSLEKQHAILTLLLAHSADIVMGCRMLDTGSASDVSGVLRITHGGGTIWDESDDADDLQVVDRNREYLYHVSGDGHVQVFERGASNG